MCCDPISSAAAPGGVALIPEQPPTPNGLVYKPDFITEAENSRCSVCWRRWSSTPSPCTGKPPGAPCATSAWTTGTSPGSWYRPIPCPTTWPGCGSVPRHWSTSTRASLPRSWSPDTRRGPPSAGTVTRPYLAPRWLGCPSRPPAECASSAARETHARWPRSPGTALGLSAVGCRPVRLAALHPIQQGPALLRHLPDA
jgi:hypothetical protein